MPMMPTASPSGGAANGASVVEVVPPGVVVAVGDVVVVGVSACRRARSNCCWRSSWARAW